MAILISGLLFFDNSIASDKLEGTVTKAFKDLSGEEIANLYSSYQRNKKYIPVYERIKRLDLVTGDELGEIVCVDNMRVKAKELMSKIQKNRLTVSSICQVSTLPKETVRRKVRALVARKILSQTKSEGVLVGPGYKLIFDETVPKTTLAFSKLIKKWKVSGILDNLLRL